MKRFALCAVAAFAVLAGVDGRVARASDDLNYATPVVLEDSSACAGRDCGGTQEGLVLGRRWPAVRWFQDHRPVRRALRGAARFVFRPGCRG